jgi:hypothetical protein
MRRASFLFLSLTTLLALGACNESSVSGIGGGTTTTSTSTNSTSSTGGEGTGASCNGDAAKWAAITAGPFTCTKSSDCCVVVNACLSQAQIVLATDFAAAQTDWPTCESQCNGCIPPAVEVGCVNGECVGEVVDAGTTPDASIYQSHCGMDAVTVGSPASTHTFGCGG